MVVPDYLRTVGPVWLGGDRGRKAVAVWHRGCESGKLAGGPGPDGLIDIGRCRAIV